MAVAASKIKVAAPKVSRITRQASKSQPSAKRYIPTAGMRNERAKRVTKRLAHKLQSENRAAETTAFQSRREFLSKSITNRQREGIGIRRSERLQTQLIEKPAVNAIKPATNSVILVIIVSFALIIFYAIVTHSAGFTGFLAGLTNFIATFSQTGPLFAKSSGTKTLEVKGTGGTNLPSSGGGGASGSF